MMLNPLKSKTKLPIRTVFIFLLVYFIPNLFAQYPNTSVQPSGPSMQFQSIWYSSSFPWQLIALVAVLISFLFAALAFMVSKIFQSSDLDKLAKYEFLYALSTLLLVIFIVSVVDVIAVKSGQFVYLLSSNLYTDQNNMLKTYVEETSGYSPFAVAEFYVSSLNNLAIKRFQDVFCITFPLFTLTTVEQKNNVKSSFDFLKYFSGNTFTSQATIGSISLILFPLNLAMSNLSYLIYSLYLQGYFLSFVQQTMLTIFLPIGIVLRGFPFVRSVGNLFIAVAIGFYFVYPITYSLFLVMGSQGSSQINFLEKYEDVSLSCLRSTISNLAVIGWKTITILLNPNLSIANGINESVNALIGELFIFGFVYPILSLVLTYTFIKSFGIILNADIQELAEGIVKLI